ncbi:unnamed protein product [Arabis nemorensis]|uniref:CTLH domain-containing protein n=1 Tax=Arabis nemorensis TaxID=586526 RepID=A0A565CWE3_9BRAS|nr:unnamed protein product [Arabis nemorensis]
MDERASKRAKTTVAKNPTGLSGQSSVLIPGVNNSLDTIGSKGLVKKFEFIRIITEALISLGFDDIAALLEEKSGIPLLSPIVKQFLKLVEDGEWDKSINALQGFQLQEQKVENAVKFLLLEQKFFEVSKIRNGVDAPEILKEMMRLDVDSKHVHKLAYQLLSPGEYTENVNSRSEIVKKLQDLFPPGVIILERRLECLIERSLEYQVYDCGFHNVPDSELSICYDHDCEDHKIPSETVQTLEEHTDEVRFLKFSHNGRYLASSKDKSAIIWEINAEGKFSLKHKLEGHQNPVVEVLWSPDDRQVITCGENEVIRSWDVDSGAFVCSYHPRNGVGSVSCGWFHDGSGIIGGMADRRIYLWNLKGAEIEHKQGQQALKLSDVAMTTDGKWLVSAGRGISLFDRETNRVEKVIVEEDIITSFSLSNDNRYLLINLIKQKIHLWNILGKPRKISGFVGHGHKTSQFIIRSCFGGYDEDFIASGSEDSKVYIWHRTESKKPCRVLSGHSGAVNCVSWNPMDMHMLASASDDGTIRIWGIDKNLN